MQAITLFDAYVSFYIIFTISILTSEKKHFFAVIKTTDYFDNRSKLINTFFVPN
jgi:hypothetical protein